MDFRDEPGQAAWRNEVRDFLAEARPPTQADASGEEATWRNNPRMREWRRKLAARGWIAPAWPKEYGGAGLGVMEQFIMNEELAEAEVVSPYDTGVNLIGPTLIVHGSDEQRREHLARILAGEIIWCQGFSEPGSGSDLASLQTRAVRDGDDFIINGQKIWTSNAHESDWIFMLARTDPDAPKHRGISMFLIDMQTPGVSVRPLINITNRHGFNETFFEDVRVPARNVVGEVNRGWYISTTTLDFERSAVGSAVGQRKTVEACLHALRERQLAGGAGVLAALKSELAERWIEAAVARLLSSRVASMQARGLVPNYEASMVKLYSSELGQRIAQTTMKTMGAYGMSWAGDGSPIGAHAVATYLGSVSGTIAGGTSEIQRNIIATRGLGLPRT